MATREQVVAEARSWLNTRFRHQARIKGVGVDCLNLVVGINETLNLVPGFNWNDHPEYHGYGKAPNGALLISACDLFLKKIDPKDALPGDILVLKFVEEPQHFAVVTQLNPTCIVHAYMQMRRVVEHSMDKSWWDRVAAAYRFEGVED